MIRRPTCTLLLITRQRIARADFRRGSPPALVGFWQQPTPDTEDTALLVEVALALGPRPARRVWVLSTELWTQTLTVEAATLAALPVDEVARALSFEAEPLSGLNALDAALGHRLLSQEKGQFRYWITQAPADELARIEQVVQQAGGRLAGMCHPGGLPRPIASAPQPSWERVELWLDTVVCSTGRSQRSERVLVVNSPPQQPRWREEYRLWQPTPSANQEVLISGDDLAVFAGDREPLLRLDDEETLTSWMTGWADQLLQRPADVPVLRPAPQPLSPNARGGIALALLLLVVALCAGHNVVVRSAMTPLQAELASLQAQRSRLAAFAKQKTDLEKTQKKLAGEIEAQRAKIDMCRRGMEVHRSRLAKLLDILASDCPRDLFVQKIETDAEVTRLHGYCAQSRDANEFAADLDRDLQDYGWSAVLREQTLSTGNGLYAFQIEISEAVRSGRSAVSGRQ